MCIDRKRPDLGCEVLCPRLDRFRRTHSDRPAWLQHPHKVARRLLPHGRVLEIRVQEAAGTLEAPLFGRSGKIQEGTLDDQEARALGAEEVDILGCLELQGRPGPGRMGNTPLCQDLQRQDADHNVLLGSEHELHRRRADIPSRGSPQVICRTRRGVYRNRRRHHTRMLGISGISLFDSYGSRSESRELLLLLHGRRNDSGYLHDRTARYSLRNRR